MSTKRYSTNYLIVFGLVFLIYGVSLGVILNHNTTSTAAEAIDLVVDMEAGHTVSGPEIDKHVSLKDQAAIKNLVYEMLKRGYQCGKNPPCVVQ